MYAVSFVTVPVVVSWKYPPVLAAAPPVPIIEPPAEEYPKVLVEAPAANESMLGAIVYKKDVAIIRMTTAHAILPTLKFHSLVGEVMRLIYTLVYMRSTRKQLLGYLLEGCC